MPNPGNKNSGLLVLLLVHGPVQGAILVLRRGAFSTGLALIAKTAQTEGTTGAFQFPVVEEPLRMPQESPHFRTIVQAYERFLRGEEPTEVLKSLVDEVLRLTDCESGFLAESSQIISTTPNGFKVLANSGSPVVKEVLNSWPPPNRDTWLQNEVSDVPGVRSWAQFPIIESGRFLGFVGLLNCRRGFTSDLEKELSPLWQAMGSLLVAWTDRKRSAESLSQSQNDEEALRMAIDGATEGVWDLDLVTGQTYLSETWLANFGWLPKDFPDRESMSRLVHPEDYPRLQKALIVHGGGKTLRFEMEYRLLCKSGEYVSVLGRGKVVKRDKFGRPLRIVGTTIDLTEYKKVQGELISAQKNMVESAKFSALGVMAAGIAHEINNPLAIIQAYSQTFEDYSKLTPGKVEKSRLAIQRSVERISKIIRGLRKVARNAEGDPFELVHVKSILDEVLSFSNERILSHGIDFRVNCDAALKIYCQPVQLSQVLLNLLNNSVDALEDQSKKWISFEARSVGDRVLILFSDSGVGIPQSLQTQVFEPFFTTKQVGRGTGLGLSISRSIIEDHGGRFYIQNRRDPTCFVVELPLADAKETTAKETA